MVPKTGNSVSKAIEKLTGNRGSWEKDCGGRANTLARRQKFICVECSGCSATTQGEMSAALWWQHDSNSVQALQTTSHVLSVPPNLMVSNATRENMTAVLPLIGPNKYMQYPLLYERKHSLPTSSLNIYFTPISVQRNNFFATISVDKPANVSHFRDNNPSTSHFGSLAEETPARKKRLPSK